MATIFYTAVGRFEKRSNGCGRSCPVIILRQQEYMVDMQEMVIWAALNWRISKPEDIERLYEASEARACISTARTCMECVNRLVTRGLVVSGSGDTDFDALYDLLNSLYIIPATGSFPLRLFSFLKLTLWDRVPFSAAKKLLRKDNRSAEEAQVMSLVRQALLSTAELIKCAERQVTDLSTGDKLMAALYDDADTTSDNIGSLMRISPCKEPVTVAVANLYLRQQIIFERI